MQETLIEDNHLSSVGADPGLGTAFAKLIKTAKAGLHGQGV